VQQEAGVLLWHHALNPGAGKLAALVAAGAAGACLGMLEAPGATAPERCCALGILAGVARAGEAGRADVAAARTRKVDGPDRPRQPCLEARSWGVSVPLPRLHNSPTWALGNNGGALGARQGCPAGWRRHIRLR